MVEETQRFPNAVYEEACHESTSELLCSIERVTNTVSAPDLQFPVESTREPYDRVCEEQTRDSTEAIMHGSLIYMSSDDLLSFQE